RHALNVLPEKRGLSPSNAKGPVSDDGAFRTFLRWQGMLSDPANFSIRHALIWSQGPPLLALRARCWLHQIRPSKLTDRAAAAAPHTWASLQLVEAKLTARVRANPHRRRSYGRRVYLQDAADNTAISKHVVIIIVPLVRANDSNRRRSDESRVT